MTISSKQITTTKLTKDQLEEKILEVLRELEDIGLEFNDKKQTLDYLKHSDIIKTIMDLNLPPETTTFESGGKIKEMSVRDREAKARTSNQFKTHMKAIKEASIAFAPIKHKYDSLIRLYETLNTIFLKRTQ